MTVVVMMLTAAAVLAWPSAYPISRLALGRASVGGGAVGDGAVGDGSARAGKSVHAGSSRTVVPVAEVAGVIDLLALTLRGGVGLVEAMEAVATRVGGLLGLHLQTVAAAGRWGVDDATAWASVPTAYSAVVLPACVSSRSWSNRAFTVCPKCG